MAIEDAFKFLNLLDEMEAKNLKGEIGRNY